jgi:capsular polysaccharide biosynthesis protein
MSTLRRRRGLIAAAAVAGGVLGAVYGTALPPQYSSSSQVLVSAQNVNGEAAGRDIQTQVQVAGSSIVLDPAGESVDPRLSVEELSQRLEIDGPTSDVVRIRARADTPARAEELSQAVAESYVDYLENASSSLTNAQLAGLEERRRLLNESLDEVTDQIEAAEGRLAGESASSVEGRADSAALAQLTAEQASLVLQIDAVKEEETSGNRSIGGPAGTVIQEATPAIRPGVTSRIVLVTAAGAVLASVLVSLLVLMLGRRDRRLRSRDEIADAIGSPVIGSVRSRAAKAAAGWTSLLGEYAPGTVDAWAFRQALRQLVARESSVTGRRPDPADVRLSHPSSMLVVTLSGDVRGLALGPQLASYAASVGIRTRFVAAQSHEEAAVLWAACSSVRANEEPRRGLVVDALSRKHKEHDVELTVMLAVVDRNRPELERTLPRTAVTVLAVSAGTCTAEELARVAVTADDADRSIDGILVADPDSLDRTTGRLLQRERVQTVSLPMRVTGSAHTEGQPAPRLSAVPRSPS